MSGLQCAVCCLGEKHVNKSTKTSRISFASTSDKGWNCVAWMTGLGLQQHAKAFQDEEMCTQAALRKLTHDQLIQLGVLKMGPRNTILDAIDRMSEPQTGTHAQRHDAPGYHHTPHQPCPTPTTHHIFNFPTLLLIVISSLSPSRLDFVIKLPQPHTHLTSPSSLSFILILISPSSFTLPPIGNREAYLQ